MGDRRKKLIPDWQSDALEAIAVLKAGGVVLHPTDTVWGLAADARNPAAMRELNQIKGRPEDTPLIVLVADSGALDRMLPDLPEGAWELMENSDRPVTVVAPAAESRFVQPHWKGSDGRIAVRWVQDDPYTAFVVRGLGGGLASTSANLTGGKSPGQLADVPDEIQQRVGHISSHRRQDQPRMQPSMMIGFDDAGRFELLRG